MTDLIPLTAFGADTARAATFGPLYLRETPDLALASLATHQNAAAPFGLILPAPGRWRENGRGQCAVWIAQGQWMILSDSQAETDFAATVKAECPEAQVTEQTDAWVSFDLSAETPQALTNWIEHTINLPAAAIRPGCATRTGLHHMSVILIRRDNTCLTILGMRSQAESLWQAVSVVAKQGAETVWQSGV